MESVEIRIKGELPLTIPIRPSPRLNKLAEEIAEHGRAIHELEQQCQSMEVEVRRLSGAGTLETSQKRAELKRQLQSAERRLAEHEGHRNRIQAERSDWIEQIALKEYQRRRLVMELGEARPGPVSDWSYARTYNIGEREQRTTGDVKRDLRETLIWLIRFAGEDAELTRELQQLEQQAGLS